MRSTKVFFLTKASKIGNFGHFNHLHKIDKKLERAVFLRKHALVSVLKVESWNFFTYSVRKYRAFSRAKFLSLPKQKNCMAITGHLHEPAWPMQMPGICHAVFLIGL